LFCHSLHGHSQVSFVPVTLIFLRVSVQRFHPGLDARGIVYLPVEANGVERDPPARRGCMAGIPGIADRNAGIRGSFGGRARGTRGGSWLSPATIAPDLKADKELHVHSIETDPRKPEPERSKDTDRKKSRQVDKQ
jgi:hypothetical protein